MATKKYTITASIEERLKKEIDTQLVRQLEKIDSIVEKVINKAVRDIIENSTGIIHNEDGRFYIYSYEDNAFWKKYSERINTVAEETIEKVLSEIKKPTSKQISELKKQFKEQYEENFNEDIESRIEEIAKEKASRDVNEALVAALILPIEKKK